MYTAHLISQPHLNYINLSSVLTIVAWQHCGRVLSLFVTSQCYVGHNDSGICKISSPLYCFLLTHIWELKFNTPKARDILIL
jgi:hypothetical protein